MLSRLFGKIKKIIFIPVDFIVVNFLKRYPVFYFDNVDNVGDLINPYIISKFSGKKTYQVKSRSIKHVVALGSMFHMANKNSVIWGTGIISDSPKYKNKTSCLSVKAVRGHLTKNILIENSVIEDFNLPLGDPGLLMPAHYQPKYKKQYRVGVIPHYVDIGLDLFEGMDDLVVIDVRQQPEPFVDQLVRCEYIVSSSLHGLILADSYKIPNKWAVFSDKITGGNFKFRDYYSTTDNSGESCFLCSEEGKLKDLVSNIEKYASVKKYIYSREELIKSFPVF